MESDYEDGGDKDYLRLGLGVMAPSASVRVRSTRPEREKKSEVQKLQQQTAGLVARLEKLESRQGVCQSVPDPGPRLASLAPRT